MNDPVFLSRAVSRLYPNTPYIVVGTNRPEGPRLLGLNDVEIPVPQEVIDLAQQLAAAGSEKMVSASQAKVALARVKRLADGTLSYDPNQTGTVLLTQVETIISNYPLDIQQWYKAALNWYRNNPYVIGIGIELGLTETEMDWLFDYAATIVE